MKKTQARAMLACIAMLCAGGPVFAVETTAADVPKLELVYAATVNIADIETVGDTQVGVLRIIPITGGTFEGKGIKGTVIPGSADWNHLRSDGTTVVEAYYFLKTSDGVTIKIYNRGVLDAKAGHRLTTPVFDAPKGKYEWLNSGTYVGTISPVKGAVIIRVFKAD